MLAAVLFGASALATLPARATGPGPTNIDFNSAATIDFPGAIRTNDRGTATGGVWFKFEAPVSGTPSIRTLAQVGRKGFAVYDSTGQPNAGDFIAHHEYRVRVNSPIPGPPGPTNPSMNGSFTLRVGYAGSVDSDSDGVFDSADNCPGVYNPPSGSPAAQSDSPPFQIGNDCRDLAPFAFTPLANDQFDGAETMSFGASGEDQVATISGAQLGEASTDNEDSFLPRSSFQINHTLWYRFTATASGAVTVNAKDANSARTNAAVAK